MKTRATHSFRAAWILLPVSPLLFLTIIGWAVYYRPPGEYNLLQHLSEARVSLRDGSNVIPFHRWVRRQWVPDGSRPQWMHVGHTTAALGRVTREAIWAHPVEGSDLIVEYPHVRWSDEFVLQYGVTDWAARLSDGADLMIHVDIQDGPSVRIIQPNEPGWNEAVIPTSSLNGRWGRLRITIRTRSDVRRHFCITGFTRSQGSDWMASSLAWLRRPGSPVEKLGRVSTVVGMFALLLVPAIVFFSRREEWGLARHHGWALVALWALVILIYGLISNDRLARQSIAPHHIYQAASFLEGRLSLPVEKPNNVEWVDFRGNQYVAFPPTPAFLALPVVAITGLATSDVILSLVVAGCNVLLFFMLLQVLASMSICRLGRRDRLWLLALLAFGTVHLAGSKLGGVWFNSQLVAMTMSTLFVLSIFARWHPSLSGLFLILGILARPSVAFYFPLMGIRLLEKDEHGSTIVANPSRLRRYVIQCATPMVIGAGLQGLFNLVRYGDPFQFGYDYLGNELAAQYGFFSLHHLPDNLRIALLQPPLFTSSFPFVQFSTKGMSVFITTPAWLGLFWLRRDMPYKWLCWLATGLVAMVTLVWASTGGQQFGYRYSLDYTVLLMLILALGKTELNRTMKGLIVLSVIINISGAIWFSPW